MRPPPRRYYFAGLAGCMVLLVLYFLFRPDASAQPLLFPDSSMHYEIVTTAREQEKGLSGRADIPDNYGMLFVFPTKDRYGFWMKDMLASIDIIWIADDGSILQIDKGVSPATYPKPYYPSEPVQYVLETRSGFTTEHGWQVGTHVPLPSPYGASDK